MIKKRKQDNLINVCSSICSVIITAHDKTLKVTQATSLVPPPPLPVRDFQVEAAFPRETRNRKGKGKVVVEEKVHGGGDHEHNNDQVVDDPSFKDNYDFKLSAQCIVQQASKHSVLPKIHSADLRFYSGMGTGHTGRWFHHCSPVRQS